MRETNELYREWMKAEGREHSAYCILMDDPSCQEAWERWQRFAARTGKARAAYMESIGYPARGPERRVAAVA